MPEEKSINDYQYNDFYRKRGGFDRNLFKEVQKLTKEVKELREEIDILKGDSGS